MSCDNIELARCSICGSKDPIFSNLAIKDTSGGGHHVKYNKIAVCSLKCLLIFTKHYEESKKRGKWDKFLDYYKIK